MNNTQTQLLNDESISRGGQHPLESIQTLEKTQEIHVGHVSTVCIEKKNSKVNEKSLEAFLTKYKVVEKKQPYTHTSMKGGIYNIPDELLKVLHQLIVQDKTPVCLTEKHPDTVSQICIDFDFRLDKKPDARIFTIEFISNIVNVYNRNLMNLGITDYSLFTAVSLYRDNGYIDPKKTNWKDGFHIQYPYIIIDYPSQFELRKRVIEDLKNQDWMPLTTNSLNDVVDEAVIKRNNWLLYGCSKPGLPPYQIREIYDLKNGELQLTPILSSRQTFWIDKLSLRLMDEKIVSSTNYHFSEPQTISSDKPKLSLSSKKATSQYDISELSMLVKILSQTRYDNYQEWIEVGLALHGTNSSDLGLLDIWIDFSKRSSKFVEGECEKLWSSFTPVENGLKVGSIYHWAKLDNPEQYAIIKRNSLACIILKSQSQTTYDCAQVIYHMFKDEYVCVSIKNSLWYHFEGHRWHIDECGVSLMNHISTTVIIEYMRLINYYNQEANEKPDEKDRLMVKSKNLTDVTYKLRDISFKEKLMKECRIVFYDSTFDGKLDVNPYLLGFNNCIYNLKTGTYSHGKPTDYVSFTTGYDYQTFEEDNPLIVAIYVFITDIFPNTVVSDYVLLLCSSFLDGCNPREKFHVWQGVGGNGKSKLVELLHYALGKKYAKTIPVAILTAKLHSGENASPVAASLKGVRLVTSQEPDEQSKFNVGCLKEWSGNDSIPARPLYREPIVFKPQFKLVFSCNHLPELPADDEGTWRRCTVLPFKRMFVTKDKYDANNPLHVIRDETLSEKLASWGPVFMYILLKHYEVYQSQDLIEPPEVKDATAQYKQSVDSIQEFIDNYLDVTNHDEDLLTLSDLWDCFKRSDMFKHNKKLKRKDFQFLLMNKLNCLFHEQKKKDNHNYRSVWTGVKYVSIDGVDEVSSETPVKLENALAND